MSRDEDNSLQLMQQLLDSLPDPEIAHTILDSIRSTKQPVSVDTIVEALLKNFSKIVELASDDGVNRVLRPMLTARELSESVRRQLLRAIVHHAALQGYWTLLQPLSQLRVEETTGDSCLRDSAMASAALGHWEAVSELMAAIPDKSARAACFGNAVLISSTCHHTDATDHIIRSAGAQLPCIQSVLQAAVNSQWDRVTEQIQVATHPEEKDLCFLATVPLAVAASQWKLVSKIIKTMSNRELKDQWSLVAVQHAASESRWDLIIQLAEAAATLNTKQECFKQTLEILLERPPASAEELSLVTHLLAKIIDNETRNQFCLAAVPLVPVEFLLQLIDTMTDWEAREDCCLAAAAAAAKAAKWDLVIKIVDTSRNASTKRRCFQELFQDLDDSAKWELAILAVGTAKKSVTVDHCCLAAIPYAARASMWDLVGELIESVARHSHEANDECCLAAIPLVAKASRWDLATQLLRKMPGLKSRREACMSALSCVSLDGNGPWSAAEFCSRFCDFLAVSEATDNEIMKCVFTLAVRSRRTDLIRHLMSQGFVPDFECHEILHGIASSYAAEGQIFAADFARAFPQLVVPTGFRYAQIDHLSFAMSLLSQAPNIDWQDSSGASALMMAADLGNGSADLVQSILQRNPTVDLQDNEGRTALSRACIAGHFNAAKALVDAGADPHHKDASGMTCAQLAAVCHQVDILETLHAD